MNLFRSPTEKEIFEVNKQFSCGLYINYYLFIKYYVPLHVSSLNAHLQEDTLHTCSIWYCHSLRDLVVAQFQWELKLGTDRPPRTLVESVSTISCIYSYIYIYIVCSPELIKGEFSQKHNLFRTDGTFCNWNYMFRPLLAIFRFLQYWKGVYKCCKNCEGGCWLRDLCISPLTTLFLVQELFVNMEKKL